ncbi:hypothetical protein GCM10009603_23970 [Nocardiopsis exhalans]
MTTVPLTEARDRLSELIDEEERTVLVSAIEHLADAYRSR